MINATNDQLVRRVAAFFTLLAALLMAGCKPECEVRGKDYEVGEHFADQDGCNSCTCTSEGVQCTDKLCADEDGGLQSDDQPANAADSGGPSCSELTNGSSQALHAALSSVGNACASDGDCTLLFLSSPCYAGCGAVLSRQGKSELEALALGHTHTLCGDFEARGCKRIIPPCVAPGPIACVAGECRELTRTNDAPDASATLVLNEYADGTVQAKLGQVVELTLHTTGPGRFGTPQLSGGALRFLDVSYPELQSPGGPTQLFRFEAVQTGAVRLTIEHEGGRPTQAREPFSLTIDVR